MTIDLSTMSRPELEQLRRKIDQALDRLARKERKLALEAAEQAARAHGYSLSELTGAEPRAAAKPKAPARYRNPANPAQSWSGRGRQPGWIKDALAQGKSLDDFEI
ncbi:H-NS histone family protein [Actibacterium sp. MT2.3-13A]|uniref:H-NS histone family protein n=1 Tax=Actibacterium sp. MT2.3-13A TaxID=2828332 RepID=UPI001BABFCE1|nr:H-NS histone family protein [Actibacterium sp. MT2.3-13A]